LKISLFNIKLIDKLFLKLI